MSDKLQQIFSKLTQTGEQITYTTNEQILDCIAETAKAFEGTHPDKTEDIKTYFSLWKELFEKLNYDDVSADLKKVHHTLFSIHLCRALYIQFLIKRQFLTTLIQLPRLR